MGRATLGGGEAGLGQCGGRRAGWEAGCALPLREARLEHVGAGPGRAGAGRTHLWLRSRRTSALAMTPTSALGARWK